MSSSDDVTPDQARRKFVSGITATALSSMAPITLLANEKNYNAQEIATEAAKKIAANGRVTLSLLIPEGSAANIEPVVSAFFDRTGISISLQQVAVDDINTQLILDSLSGEGLYDLALPATHGLSDLAAVEAIIPLSGYAKKYEPPGYRDRFLYNIGDKFDDTLFGFQTDGDAYLMFYHREMMENPTEKARYADKYGEALEVPLTWDQLDRQMAFFHRPNDKLFGGLLFRTLGYLAWEWWVRFHAKGYWPLSKTMVPQINSDAGVTALEEMIRATESLAPEVSKLGLFENWERYSRGDVFCNIGWGGTQKYLNKPGSNMKGKLLFGPTPGGMVDNDLLITPYFNWGWNYVVTSHSHKPELAYLFCLFASSLEQSTIAVREKEGYFDPFRNEHYDDPEIQNIYTPEFLSVHKMSLNSSIPDLYLANQGQYFQALNEWLKRALERKVTPEIALNNVAQKWNQITEMSNHDKQTDRWLQLRAKYPTKAQRLLKDLS